MRLKNNIFIIAAIFIIITVSPPYAASQTGLSFDIPAPPNTKLLDTRELSLGGPQIQMTIYESIEAASIIVLYYSNFFTQQRFQKIFDISDEKRGKRTLRFKKDRLIVDIMVIEKQVRRQISVSKFLQPPEETSAQFAGRLTAKNLISALSDEDEPGKDLANVPRPPQSIRMTRKDSGSSSTIMYRTPLDVAATADFYRRKMPRYRWKLTNEIATAKALEAYRQASGQAALGIKSPFPDGENFEQVISDSYMLQFSAGSDSARITIFPNFLNRQLGSMVQIVYQEKE